MKKTIKKLLLLPVLVLASFTCNAQTSDNWNTYNITISDTPVMVSEYKIYSPEKVLLLPGGDGMLDGTPETLDRVSDGHLALAASYAAQGKQLVFIQMPYFEDGRNTVEKASQEVLNVIDIALNIGYLKSNYTLIGGSAGTLIISAMLDFNQAGDVTGDRLIDNVGRVVMLSGPHNNVQPRNEEILDLMYKHNVQELTSLNTSITIEDRWDMYLNELVNDENKGLKIVVGDSDNILCEYDEECELSMNFVTDDWVMEVTSGMYGANDLPEIVKLVEVAGHALPISGFQGFI